MQTIFQDYKNLHDSPFSKILSPSNPSLHPQNPFRNSLSPYKINNKKFFYSLRSKSKKNIEQIRASKIQLQNAINLQELIIKPKRSDINSIIFAQCQKMFDQRQMMVLPSIELRQSSKDNKIRIEAEQKKIINRQMLGISDYKKRSNIFGNIGLLQTINIENPQNIGKINWKSNKIERKVYEPYIQRSKIQYPQINKIRGTPQSQHNIKPVRSNEQNPQKLKKVRSLSKLINNSNNQSQMKFKKGYLPYENQQNACFWNKIKFLLNESPVMKVNNSKLISARVYYAINLQTLKPIVASREADTIEIASLSKIMTCYLSILICTKYKVDIKTCTYRVPDKVSETPGTSAELEAGDILSVQNLLYALMLPSGNDASICLAELMGKIIQKNKKKQQKKSFYDMFLEQMNIFSKELGLPQQWRNSSGLPANPNFSTAQAIVLLSALAINNELFRKIVQTKQYEIQVKNDRYGLVKKKTWRNTNKLLQKGWQGVKTGTTQTAGHCLISKNNNILIGVFDCSTLNRRFQDCAKLYQYICTQQIPHKQNK